MDTRGWMMFRVLLNRYHPKGSDALLKFLPEDQRAVISTIDIQSHDLEPILQHAQNVISYIHYSWIKPLINRFPTQIQASIIAALTGKHAEDESEEKIAPLSNLAKAFMVNEICDQLHIQEHLPFEYLPESEFTPLATWSKQQIVELIDFLGLYDLASEVRKIVNRDYLKNIYSCLTPKEFYYLKVCLHQKDQITSPKLGIDPSKQDCAKLKNALHRRGLSRLGKAVCGEHPDFVWTIAHLLDMGRGQILLKEYQPEALPKITPILKQQVLNLMNFLKSG